MWANVKILEVPSSLLEEASAALGSVILSAMCVTDRCFFFVYLSGNVEIHKLLFDVVTCEGLCISFDENDKEDLEVPFFYSFNFSS